LIFSKFSCQKVKQAFQKSVDLKFRNEYTAYMIGFLLPMEIKHLKKILIEKISRENAMKYVRIMVKKSHRRAGFSFEFL
jgi:hypothetical protein